MHDPHVDLLASPPALRRHGARFIVLIAAALLLHAASLGGLGGLDWTWATPQAVPSPATLQVRAVETTPVAVTSNPVDADEPVRPEVIERHEPLGPIARPTRTVAATRPPPSARSKPASVIEQPAPALPAATESPITAVGPAPLAVLTSAQMPDVVVAANEAVAPAASGAPVDEPLPHYRTRIPPAMTLRYELQRGMLRGNGDFIWRPQGDHYELRLEGKVGSLAVITQVSSGGFDAGGLAPVRFTDQRMARAATAVNFQRAAGKITFSGPSTEYPLRAGTQDRLSWMMQLAAIVAAEPRLSKPEATIAMWVIGSHGEGGVWLFRCVGPETVETPSGAVEAIKYARTPRDEFDADVQIWLDPQRNNMPVRASQRSGPRDEPFQLRLLSVLAPP